MEEKKEISFRVRQCKDFVKATNFIPYSTLARGDNNS